MTEQKIKIPQLFYNMNSIDFVKSLWNLDVSDKYIFDFKEVGRIEPFTLLFLSAELKRFRDSRPEGAFVAINFDQMQEAADMGFFRAFGVNYGEIKSNWTKNLTSIPIKIYDCYEIIKSAEQQGKAVGDYLTDKATSLSYILTQSNSGHLFETLVYSIREILRNVVEHSESTQFGFCAQHWPERRKVSLAILDRGIGLKNSLSNNPHLKIDNDLEAIKLALKPGISGKAFEGAKIDETNEWTNSGYGLYMTSKICRIGGSFVIASGSSGLFLSNKREVPFESEFQGTALNLSLETSNLDSLSLTLAKFRDSEEVKNAPRTPSTASLGKK